MDEEWRPVHGYGERYWVSNLGRVKSVRYVTSRKETTTRFLTMRPGKKGHLRVALCKDGACVDFRVHILVLEAFVGPRPASEHGLHNNDDKNDNRVSNLRWGTGSENMYDRVDNGLHQMSIKEKCKRGHSLSGNNLYTTPEPQVSRQCKSCRLARSRNKKDDRVNIQMEADKIFYEVYA